MAPSSSDLPGHYAAVTAVMRVVSLFTALMENLIKKKELFKTLFPVFFLLLIYHLSKIQTVVKCK